jgi:hypothetical protein
MDVDASTLMDSFRELIFANKDVGGVVMGSSKKALEFSEFLR